MEIYVEIDGYACPFTSVPCAKCKYRYHIICPQCKWKNKYPEVNTYKQMTKKEVFKCLVHGKGIKEFKDIIKEKK